MTIQTDLSVSPHFDDFDPNKDFYKVLYRPGVSVQVRELNQLQSILQNQIKSFGDNVYKQGTIIDGCDLTFHSDLKHIKLKDITTDSNLVDVSSFVGYRIKNQNDLVALEASIISSDRGFEATNPDLNTVYVRYINSGFQSGGPSEGILEFFPNDQLTVYNPNQVVERIVVPESGRSQGFSTNDRVVIVSAIEVQNTSGGLDFTAPFNVGDFITDGTANVEIIEIISDSIENSLVFRIKPTALSLSENDSTKWTLSAETNIQRQGVSPSSIGRIKSILGTGAAAKLKTSNLGRIESIDITNKGVGYTIAPSVSITSISNQISNIQQVNAIAQTFLATVTVGSPETSPIGSSYAVTVGGGIVYQKGYFSRVAEQFLIVEKYSNQPTGLVVGFETQEDIINSNQDVSLLDNATGAPNETAPGANRLKLTPKLVKLTKGEADQRNDFLYIAEFSDGKPFKQNRQTVFNVIGNEISRRISEESGDYVIDQFLLQTKSPASLSQEQESFSIVIDPGKAYINGFRVETESNFETLVPKGIDSVTTTQANISLNFGNFVRVSHLAGHFNFKQGATVELYAEAHTYFQTPGQGVTKINCGLTQKIGNARIRSVVFDSGVPGTSSAVYRLYLFDIKMLSGSSFGAVGTVFYDGTDKGVSRVLKQGGLATLEDTTSSNLLFYAGSPAVKQVSNVSYIYRTSSEVQLGTDGTFTVALSSGGTESFPYTGQLSAIQERDVVITPKETISASSNLSGTISVTSGSSTATVSGSIATTIELQAGDYIEVGSSGIVQILEVQSNSVVILSQAATFTASTTYKRVFPANVAIPFEYRANRTIIVDNTRKNLTVSVGLLTAASKPVTVYYNVRETNATPVAKSVNRNRLVRIVTGTNPALNVGPWCLGVSDVFRLNGVYLGSGSSFSPSDVGVQDVTQFFYIDHNQNLNYTNQSYLYLKPNSALQLENTADKSLLISFDYFSIAPGVEGLKVPGGSSTYNINDSLPITEAPTSVNTLEIPEIFGDRGEYFDLRDQFDFRPNIQIVTSPSTVANIAPINPVELDYSAMFTSNDKKFPAPDSELSATIEYYQGRTDLIVIDSSSEFRIIKGNPGSRNHPKAPENALIIQSLNIPAYPSIPFILSGNTLKYADTKVANGRYSTRRLNDYRISTLLSKSDIVNFQPRRYTMKDIGTLERRLEQLEYYTSLNLVETIAQKRIIPGSDGLNRFKFGFYVDGFEDYSFADTSNPLYSASIVDGYLSPNVLEVNLKMGSTTGQETVLPFNEVTLISQTRATDGGISSVVENVQRTQTIVCVQQAQRSRNKSNSGNIFEDFFYTMSETSGPVEFYINSRDNLVGAEVFQSKNPEGPWVATKSSATAALINRSDVSTKRLNLNGTKIENVGGSNLDRKSTPVGTTWGTWLEDQFKMLWTHNPENGIYYRIRIYKGGRAGGIFSQGKSGTFEYRLCYPTDGIVNATLNQATTNYPLTYFGTAISGSGGSNSPISLTHIH